MRRSAAALLHCNNCTPASAKERRLCWLLITQTIQFNYLHRSLCICSRVCGDVKARGRRERDNESSFFLPAWGSNVRKLTGDAQSGPQRSCITFCLLIEKAGAYISQIVVFFFLSFPSARSLTHSLACSLAAAPRQEIVWHFISRKKTTSFHFCSVSFSPLGQI